MTDLASSAATPHPPSVPPAVDDNPMMLPFPQRTTKNNQVEEHETKV